MSPTLPRPVELYFAAENAGNPASLDACFCTDASVLDEGRIHAGLAAIKRWKAESKRKYGHTVKPLRSEDRDGMTVVESRVSGNFPGSAVTLEFGFTLSGGKIASLEIHG